VKCLLYDYLEIRFFEPEWYKTTISLRGLGHYSSVDYQSFTISAPTNNSKKINELALVNQLSEFDELVMQLGNR
jgi:hypothetical protein